MRALAEAYPELRAAESFQRLQAELAGIEDEIQASRRIYNANVQDYNTRIQVFPTILIAGPMSFDRARVLRDRGGRGARGPAGRVLSPTNADSGQAELFRQYLQSRGAIWFMALGAAGTFIYGASRHSVAIMAGGPVVVVLVTVATCAVLADRGAGHALLPPLRGVARPRLLAALEPPGAHPAARRRRQALDRALDAGRPAGRAGDRRRHGPARVGRSTGTTTTSFASARPLRATA